MVHKVTTRLKVLMLSLSISSLCPNKTQFNVAYGLGARLVHMKTHANSTQISQLLAVVGLHTLHKLFFYSLFYIIFGKDVFLNEDLSASNLSVTTSKFRPVAMFVNVQFINTSNTVSKYVCDVSPSQILHDGFKNSLSL
jgi:hypothetical protein